MVHTKYMVERSIKADKDEVVGAGQLFDVNRFIRDLYKEFNMDYSYYVNERLDTESKHKEKNYYSQQNELYLYETLLKDTINDLKNKL